MQSNPKPQREGKRLMFLPVVDCQVASRPQISTSLLGSNICQRENYKPVHALTFWCWAALKPFILADFKSSRWLTEREEPKRLKHLTCTPPGGVSDALRNSSLVFSSTRRVQLVFNASHNSGIHRNKATSLTRMTSFPAFSYKNQTQTLDSTSMLCS